MSERLFISIASVAALVCAAVLLYVMTQISHTRLALQSDGVVEFNFIQQTDHNLDEFVHALRRYQTDGADDPDAARDYLTRFDILWSAARVDRGHWTGGLTQLADTAPLLKDLRDFIDRVEPLMVPERALADAEIGRLEGEARELSERVYRLGTELYQQKGRVRVGLTARIDRLITTLWFFGTVLTLTVISLFALLGRAYRRASRLVDESDATHRELARALAEVTDGAAERRRQNRFIATASHDLRQPLHALGLYLATLRGHVTTRLGRTVLDNASRSIESLNQLLNGVLDLSRLDAEVIEVEHVDFDLDELFEQLHGNFAPEAAERGIDFEVRLSGLTVHTDRVLLERVLANLVSNALRYTAEGRVALAAEPLGERVRVVVEDTGVGIPEHEREAVFDEYYQLDDEAAPVSNGHAAERSRGLGLGLAIVRRLTRLLDIELAMHSAAGTGTRFELDVAAGARARVDVPRASATGRFDGVHFDGLTVLVIDDDRDVREGMHVLLEQRSCRVMVAESASEARAAIVAEELVPDIVVADYRLRDGQTGDRAIAEVREEVNEDVPALIVTGDTSPARLREASASGFRLLHKPLVPEELFDAIGELAGRGG